MMARPNPAPGARAAATHATVKWTGGFMLAIFIAFAPVDLLAQEAPPSPSEPALPRLFHASKAERSVENGVTVWRGSTPPDALPLAGGAPAAAPRAAQGPLPVRIEVQIVKRYPPRRLRTHRIFGQSPGESRRFTQGFYSDRTAAR